MSESSKGRLIAFRVVAGLSLILSLLTFAFAAPSWSEEGSIHRVHNLSMAITVLMLMTIPLALSIKSPERHVGAFRLWLSLCLAGVVAGMLSADLIKPEGYLISTVLGVLTFVLHPAMKEVGRCVKGNALQLLISAAALAPAFVYAMNQADLQKAGDPTTNEHVEFHHYSGMGWVALSLGLAGIGAAFRADDKVLAGRMAGATAILVGALSLVYPDFDGAYETMWAGLTIAFGIVYIAIGEMEAKKGTSESGRIKR